MGKRISKYAIYIALCFIFSYIESLITLPVMVPGIKLGLGNIVVLYILYDNGSITEMLGISLVRAVISMVLFGNFYVLAYSLFGGILSVLVMYVIKKYMSVFGVVGISIIGGVTHNIGQLLMSAILIQTKEILYYLPVLLVAGAVCGLVIGILAGICIKRVTLAKNVTMMWALLLLASMSVSFAGCSNNSAGEKVSKEYFFYDTVVDITLYGVADTKTAEDIFIGAEKLLSGYDNMISAEKTDSDIGRLNASSGKEVLVSEETYGIIKRSVEIGNETEGLFDVSLFPVIKAWGFHNEEYKVPDDTTLVECSKCIGYKDIELLADNRIKMPEGYCLDLGGIGKGYISERLTEYLSSFVNDDMITGGVVSLGGNIQVFGSNGKDYFNIGIAAPNAPGQIVGKVHVNDKCVITSGSYERYFEKDGERYHHIIDPNTLAPAKSDLKSVTVISEDGAGADAYATALFIMGFEKAKAFYESCLKDRGYSLVLIDNTDNIWFTEGCDFYEGNMDS